LGLYSETKRKSIRDVRSRTEANSGGWESLYYKGWLKYAGTSGAPIRLAHSANFRAVFAGSAWRTLRISPRPLWLKAFRATYCGSLKLTVICVSMATGSPFKR
jgi:hypothetical protein